MELNFVPHMDDVDAFYIFLEGLIHGCIRQMMWLVGGLVLLLTLCCVLLFGGCVYFFVHLGYEKYCMKGAMSSFHPTLKGKVAIVTGATSGIGFETAKQLAVWGAHVILAERDPVEGMNAAREIRSAVFADRKSKQRITRDVHILHPIQPQNPSDTMSDDEYFSSSSESEQSVSVRIKPGHVEVMDLDLMSLASVRAFARRFYRTGLPLHILVNNAGVMWPPLSFTKDGFELQFGVNYLGHFLLTRLLASTLKRSGSVDNPSRVVSVSSIFHHMAWDIQISRSFTCRRYLYWRSYAESKAALAMFAVELGRRLKGQGVVSHAVHPGAVKTCLFRSYPWYWKAIIRIVSPLVFLSPTRGADCSLFAAVHPDGAKETGMYYSQSKPARMSGLCQSQAKRTALWETSMMLTQRGSRRPEASR